MLLTVILALALRIGPEAAPPGHAAVTFAAATVIERHVGWRHSLLAYAVATYVVAFGAAVGTIAGRTVTQHGRDNWTLIPIDVPGGSRWSRCG